MWKASVQHRICYLLIIIKYIHAYKLICHHCITKRATGWHWQLAVSSNCILLITCMKLAQGINLGCNAWPRSIHRCKPYAVLTSCHASAWFNLQEQRRACQQLQEQAVHHRLQQRPRYAALTTQKQCMQQQQQQERQRQLSQALQAARAAAAPSH
jgi:hypothetical protein